MGAKKWDGGLLQPGWNGFINGKEVELDSLTRPEVMPVIKGKDFEYENELEFGSPPGMPDQNSHLVESTISGDVVKTPMVQTSPIQNAPSASKPYIPPSSFYANKSAKPKSPGPLYVLLWMAKTESHNRICRHDPNAEGAIVMKDPGEEYHAKHNRR